MLVGFIGRYEDKNWVVEIQKLEESLSEAILELRRLMWCIVYNLKSLSNLLCSRGQDKGARFTAYHNQKKASGIIHLNEGCTTTKHQQIP